MFRSIRRVNSPMTIPVAPLFIELHFLMKNRVYRIDVLLSVKPLIEMVKLVVFQPGIDVSYTAAFNPRSSGSDIWDDLKVNGYLSSTVGVCSEYELQL